SFFGLVRVLFGVVEFFHLRFALIQSRPILRLRRCSSFPSQPAPLYIYRFSPGRFCACVVALLFQVSQRRSIYIERESFVLLAPDFGALSNCRTTVCRRPRQTDPSTCPSFSSPWRSFCFRLLCLATASNHPTPFAAPPIR